MRLSSVLLALPLLMAMMQLPPTSLAASLYAEVPVYYAGHDDIASVNPMANGPRGVRQANLQGSGSGKVSGQEEGAAKVGGTAEIEQETDAKAKGGAKFGFGLGLSGLSLTGDTTYEGGVDSKTKVHGDSAAEGAQKGQGEAEGQTSGKGGLLFPNMLGLLGALGRIAPEGNVEYF